MDSAQSSGVRTTLTRLLNVGLDGLVQAAVVAMVVFVLGVIWAWGRHLDVVSINRVIGALIAALSISIISSLIAVLRQCVLWIRNRPHGLSPKKGFLDHKLDAEAAMLALPAITAKLAAIMNDVGTAIDQHTNDLQRASSTAQHLKVSEAASRSLDKYSARVDRARIKYVQIGDSLSLGLNGWSKWIEEAHPSKAGFADFPESLRGFIPAIDQSNNQLRTYIATTGNIRGISSALNAAVDRHVISWEEILNTNLRIHAACCETLRVIDSLT